MKLVSAQFQYGTDKNDYNTQAKINFVKHDLSQVVAAKQERQ